MGKKELAAEHQPLAMPKAQSTTPIPNERSRDRQWKILALLLSIGLIVALFFALLALIQLQGASRQANLDLSRRLGAEALNRVNDQVDLSLLLAVEASKAGATYEARNSLLAVMESNPHLLAFIRDLPSDIVGLTFSADSQTLLAVDEHSLMIWSIAASHSISSSVITKEPAQTWSPVTFSPDRTQLVLETRDGKAHLWSTIDGQWIEQPFPEHLSSMGNYTFSSDGGLLAISGCELWDKKHTFPYPCLKSAIYLWNAAKQQLVGQMAPENTELNRVAFSPDGKQLAAGDRAGTIFLWALPNLQSLGKLSSDHYLYLSQMVFSPDSKLLAINGATSGDIIVWDVVNQKVLTKLAAHNSVLTGLAFEPNGKILASSSCGQQGVRGICYWGEIRLWDTTTWRQIDYWPTGYPGYAAHLTFSPDGELLASSSGSIIALWHVPEQLPFVQTMDLSTSAVDLSNFLETSLALSPDDKTLARGVCTKRASKYSFCIEGEIQLWDIASQQIVSHIPLSHTNFIESLAFSPNGNLLAWGSCLEHCYSHENGPREILFADATTGQLVGAPIRDHAGKIVQSIFSPDSTLFATIDRYKEMLRVWNVTTHQLVISDTTRAFSLAFSPDSKTLAIGGKDSINLLDMTTGLSLGQMFYQTAQPQLIYSLAFSPNGQLLAAGSSFGEDVVLWDVAKRQPLGAPLVGHRDGARGLAFSSDGKILTVNTIYGIYIWDVEARRLLGHPISANLSRETYSLDGSLLASFSTSGQHTIWNLDPKAWSKFACRITNRNLTQEEWHLFLGDKPYDRTCLELP